MEKKGLCSHIPWQEVYKLHACRSPPRKIISLVSDRVEDIEEAAFGKGILPYFKVHNKYMHPFFNAIIQRKPTSFFNVVLAS
jgi:hypothetical protein